MRLSFLFSICIVLVRRARFHEFFFESGRVVLADNNLK